MMDPLPENEDSTFADSHFTEESPTAVPNRPNAANSETGTSNLFFTRGPRETFNFERLRNLVRAKSDDQPQEKPEREQSFLTKANTEANKSYLHTESRFQCWMEYLAKQKKEENKKMKKKKRKEEQRRKMEEEKRKEEEEEMTQLTEEDIFSTKTQESSSESTMSSDSGTSWYDLSSSAQSDSKENPPQHSPKERTPRRARACAGERAPPTLLPRSPPRALSPPALRRVFTASGRADFRERARRYRDEVRRRRGERVWTWETLVEPLPQPLEPAPPPPAAHEERRRRRLPARYSPTRLRWISKDIRRQMREDVHVCELTLKELERTKRRELRHLVARGDSTDSERKAKSHGESPPAVGSNCLSLGYEEGRPTNTGSACGGVVKKNNSSDSELSENNLEANGTQTKNKTTKEASLSGVTSCKVYRKCVFLKNDALEEQIRDLRGKAAESYDWKSSSSGHSSDESGTSFQEDNKISANWRLTSKRSMKRNININPVPQATLLRAQIRAANAAKEGEGKTNCQKCQMTRAEIMKLKKWKLTKKPDETSSSSRYTIDSFNEITFGRKSPIETMKPERDRPYPAKSEKNKIEVKGEGSDVEVEPRNGTGPVKKTEQEKRQPCRKNPIPCATEQRARARALAAEHKRLQLQEDLRMGINQMDIAETTASIFPGGVEPGVADGDHMETAERPRRVGGAGGGGDGNERGVEGGGGGVATRVRLPPIAGAPQRVGGLRRVRSIFEQQLARAGGRQDQQAAPQDNEKALCGGKAYKHTRPQGGTARAQATATATTEAEAEKALATAASIAGGLAHSFDAPDALSPPQERTPDDPADAIRPPRPPALLLSREGRSPLLCRRASSANGVASSQRVSKSLRRPPFR